MGNKALDYTALTIALIGADVYKRQVQTEQAKGVYCLGSRAAGSGSRQKRLWDSGLLTLPLRRFLYF